MDNCGCNGNSNSNMGSNFNDNLSMGSILGGGMGGNNNNNNNNNSMNVSAMGNNNNNNNNMNLNNMGGNNLDLSNLPPPSNQVGNPINNPMDVRNNNGNGNGNDNGNGNGQALASLLKQIKENKDDKPREETKVKIILLGVVTAFGVASALSWHEAIKYYISRSIKLNQGNPMYYLYYAIGSTLLTAIMFMQSKKLLN
jgi:hypothetical protein